ncbi:hypothetical protein CF319_g4179 [Tilletia indica]|nr:hypothetical protein CF319_g4179 [Tilletia indica]
MSGSLEDEILQSRIERSNRRSRLLDRGVKGISPIATSPDTASSSASAFIDNNDIDALVSPKMPAEQSTPSQVSASASNNSTAPNVLSRYGGQAGPTGATHAPTPSTGPVSLANFMGGRTAGPRLGKLQGDGRSAPPEAEEFLAQSGTSPTRRGIPLPGMASPPLDSASPGTGRPLAAFLAARADAAAGTSPANTPSTSAPPTAQNQRSGPSVNDRAAMLASPTQSSDRFPTASLTRLSAKGVVGQRIQEAKVRQLSGSDSPESSDRLGSATTNNSQQGLGLAALRERWAHAGSAGAGATASAPSGLSIATSGTAAGPARISPTKERAAMFSNPPTPSASQSTQANPWKPGRSANALPGLASNFGGASTAAGVTRNRSDPVLPAASNATSDESASRSPPVRLPGLGGPSTPARLLTSDSNPSTDRQPQEQTGTRQTTSASTGSGAAASTGQEVQVLKSLTASRPRGPAGARKSRGTGATAAPAAQEKKTEETVAIPTFQSPSASSPVREKADDQVPSPLARNPLPRPPSPDKAAYANPVQGSVGAGKSEPPVAEKAVKKPDPPKGRRSTVGKRILVLISGSGSNFQALIDATIPSLRTTGQPQIPYAQIVGVISNRKAAFGLERARVADPPIPAEVFSLKSFRDSHPGQGRDEYDEALATMVLGYAPDIVVLAGFMHIVSPHFLRVLGHASSLGPGNGGSAAPVPIINLHPALPGQFDGAGAIERAFEAYQAGSIAHTGVMVHEVIAEVDRGAPVLVESVDMTGLKTVTELEEKIHAVEHRLIVDGTRKVLDRPLPVSNSAANSVPSSPRFGVAGMSHSSPNTSSDSPIFSAPSAWDQARPSHSRRISLQSATKRQSLLFTNNNSGASIAAAVSAMGSSSSGTKTPGSATPRLAQLREEGPFKVDVNAVVASVANFRAKQVKAARADASSGFTVSVEVLAIAPDGSTRVLSHAEMRTLYDSEILAVVHRTKSSPSSTANSGSGDGAAATRTRIFVRIGSAVHLGRTGGSWKEGRQGDKVAELARRYNVPAEEVVEVVQGCETPELAAVLAGGSGDDGGLLGELICREGSRPVTGLGNLGSAGDASVMFVVRRVGPAVMIDQVALATSYLCSSQSVVASLLNDVFVWHGKGSTAAQRQSAEHFAIASLAGGDVSRLQRNEEGSEDDQFGMFFDLREGYASAWHHRHHSTLPAESSIPVLLELTPSDGLNSNSEPEPRIGTALGLEDPNGVSVLDLGLEIYVLVASAARASKTRIAAALDVADALASQAQTRLSRPSIPVHVVILPGSLPRDLRAALRGGSSLSLASGAGAGKGQLNVWEGAEARAHLKRDVGDFSAAELADSTCLPLGVSPEDL